MKHTLTQYITLGVMLFLLFFIVSLLPEQQSGHVTDEHTKVQSISTANFPVEAGDERSN